MARSVKIWVGKTDDEPIPNRVRVRIFLNNGGHCALCTRKIMTGERWTCDHIVALINGGENSEANLQPLCINCDKSKTKNDVAEKSEIYTKVVKRLGLKRHKNPIPGSRGSGFRRKMDGTVIRVKE